MADEIDAGKIVAEIVLETQQARENAEEIEEKLEEVDKKVASPKLEVDTSNFSEIVNEELERLRKNRVIAPKVEVDTASVKNSVEKVEAELGEIDKKIISPQIKPKLDTRIQNSYKELEDEISKNVTPTIKPQIDTSLVEKSYDDTVNEICTILEKIGITGDKANKIIEACFQDVSSLKKYQNQLQILADKIELARCHYQELAQAKSNAEKQKNSAEVDKLTSAMEKQVITIKSLEAQFENTYSQMDNVVKKSVVNYQKQENSAEEAMEKQLKFNQTLANRQAAKDFVGSINLATTSLRTFNTMVPDAIDGIGEIITQINMAKQAMTMGVSAPIAWGTAIVAGIGVVASLVVNEIQKVQQAEEEARQKAVEAASEYENNSKELSSLTEQFISLRSKLDNVNISRQEEIETKKELYQLQEELVKKYGSEANAIDTVTGSIQEQKQAIEELRKAEAQSLLLKSGDEYEKYKSEMKSKQEYKLYSYSGTITPAIDEIKNELSKNQNIEIKDGWSKDLFSTQFSVSLNINGEDAENEMKEISKNFRELKEKYHNDGDEESADTIQTFLNQLSQANRTYIDEAYKKRLEVYNQCKQAEEILNGTAEDTEKTQKSLSETINDTMSNSIDKVEEYSNAMSNLSSAYQTVSNGEKLSADSLSQLIEKYPELAEYVNQTGDLTLKNGEKIKEVFESQKKSLISTLEEEKKELEKQSNSYAGMSIFREEQKQIKDRISEINAELAIYNSELTELNENSASVDWSETTSEVKSLASAYQDLNEGKQLDVDTMIQLIDKYPEVASAMANEGKLGKEQADVFKQLAEAKKNDYIVSQQVAIKNLEVSRQETVGIIKNLTAQLQMYLLKGQVMQAMNVLPQLANQNANLGNINNEIDKAQARIKAIQNIDINTYGNSSGGSGSDTNTALANELKQLEHKKALGQLTSQQEYNWLVKINNKYSKNADEQMDMEKRLYNAKKQMQADEEAANTEALQAAYKGIENKKSLGKMTSQQELKQLEQIRQKYKMTAEERMELEIKIYNLKKSLKDEEISSINTLADAVTEALKEKYEEQRKLEENRINESIESWQNWEDKTVEAIQGEIDALDELANKQESENKRQEYENKRQQTELQLAYEKDDYNRTQLQKELNRLDKEEAERLAEEQREAKKKALEGRIEAVKGQSQATQERLQKQLDEVGEKYDKLTDSFSLKAQAQKFIADSTQKQIVSLIKSYASDYEIAGNTVGDALYNGMKAKMDNIEAYVDGIFGKIEAYQRQMANTANYEADKFWASQNSAQASAQQANSKSVTVQQTVNFNQPVESPVETRRQLDKTNQALAQQISSGI